MTKWADKTDAGDGSKAIGDVPPQSLHAMGNQNRKATQEEKAHARRVILEAFPDLVPVFGAHGDYGGHRAPRDHTIAFRLQDIRGRFCSNVVWVSPNALGALTVSEVRSLVDRANGR